MTSNVCVLSGGALFHQIPGPPSLGALPAGCVTTHQPAVTQRRSRRGCGDHVTISVRPLSCFHTVLVLKVRRWCVLLWGCVLGTYFSRQHTPFFLMQISSTRPIPLAARQWVFAYRSFSSPPACWHKPLLVNQRKGIDSHLHGNLNNVIQQTD